MLKPWGSIDPNSQHQLWSRWTFVINENGKHPAYKDVITNARRWLRSMFGSVGRAKVEENIFNWIITLEVEGVPSHDPIFIEYIKNKFNTDFVEKGWGNNLATGKVEVKILAGNIEDGSLPMQLIVVNPNLDII